MKKALLLSLLVISGATGQEFRIIVPATVQIMLTASDGRRVGYSSVHDSVFSEIANAGYFYGSIGSIEESDTSEPDDFYELYIDDDHLMGEFELSVFGGHTCKYYLEITRGIEPHVQFERRSYLFMGAHNTFSIEFKSDTVVLTRSLTRNSLFQDLTVAHLLGELGGKPLYDDLSRRVSKFEEFVARGDSSNAYHELEKLDKKLDEVFGKTQKGKSRDPNHFILEDAYWILREDVKSLSSTFRRN